ncbi:hypothetical protein ISF_07157 [Cordyceps fumosorosea ARSEF 2679]|uniref:BTB domain-containing protein n=1 Tax=Cordyceps fumosorosea (strain ARSEF 2679) TaxID=1081104 RepID=A0A167Q303_CORFA|nr:hypothetical protein ISF_07157 [Cordyceps fumosorosea ARSEF 2679]OAA57236.1 hypothetical protein ISF_07157 [Cordyceps fumosorosea ARSEF 2679]
MAEITYDSILSSKPYCFLVGPQEREFFIHASLAAKKSSVLDSIVSNGLTKQEANGTAVWRHVDEDTFVRFGQYVYTGDYEGSAPSQPTTAEAPPPPVAEEKEEPEPQPLPDKVAEEKPVDFPVREPATHVELEAVVEPVPDEAVVPEKDVWGFFTSRGKVGGDYDWGFSTTRASKPADEEPAAPEREREREPEDVADMWLFGVSKKDKKKKKRVLIASEPEPAEAVVELVVEEEPARVKLAEEDCWDVPAAEPELEPEPAFEPAPIEEAADMSPTPIKKKGKKKKRALLAPEPEPAKDDVEEAPAAEPEPEPARVKLAEEDCWDVPAAEPELEPEPAFEPAPIKEAADMSPTPTKKKGKKKKGALFSSQPEPAKAVVEFVKEEESALPEPDVSFRAASPQERLLPMLKDVWHSFTTELRYDPGTGAGQFDAPGNEVDSALEYAGVFLSHARVHALAHEFRVEPLAQLALHKLHRILCAFTLHEARIGDVVALLRYSYEERQRLGEQLRALVSKFAACHLKTLWTSEAFRALFAACGELAVAIVGHVIDKLN